MFPRLLFRNWNKLKALQYAHYEPHGIHKLRYTRFLPSQYSLRLYERCIFHTRVPKPLIRLTQRLLKTILKANLYFFKLDYYCPKLFAVTVRPATGMVKESLLSIFWQKEFTDFAGMVMASKTPQSLDAP